MECPNCKNVQEDEVECASCGIFFEKWARRNAYAQSGDYTGTEAASQSSYSSYSSDSSSESSGSSLGGYISLILKLCIWAGLAYGGWLGYEHYGAELGMREDSKAVKAYKTFGGKMANFDYDGANELVVGPAMTQLGMLPNPFRTREMIFEMMGSIDKIKYKIESEKAGEDGITITGTMQIKHVGTASQRGSPTRAYTYNALLREEAGEYYVYEFTYEDLN